MTDTWLVRRCVIIITLTIRTGLINILNVDINSDHWLQASSPVRDGGLGIRSAEMLASSAYLASAASTLLL